MIMNSLLFRILAIIFLILSFNLKVLAEPITVASIKDLREPLTEIKKSFEQKYPDQSINYIFDKESEIERFLRDKASIIDLVVLDRLKEAEKLTSLKLLNKKSLQKIAKDNLCIVICQGDDKLRAFMLYPKSVISKAIAVSNPDTTGLGKYTKEALTYLNLWKKLGRKLTFFNSSQEVATRVSAGTYDGGIMYCSLAGNTDLLVTDILNPKIHSPIIFASAITNRKEVNPNATIFNNFLKSKEAKNILKKYHFSF
jgi:molybdate transport system substrate-binding protein